MFIKEETNVRAKGSNDNSSKPRDTRDSTENKIDTERCYWKKKGYGSLGLYIVGKVAGGVVSLLTGLASLYSGGHEPGEGAHPKNKSSIAESRCHISGTRGISLDWGQTGEYFLIMAQRSSR